MKEPHLYPLFSRPIYVNNIEYDFEKLHPLIDKQTFKKIHFDKDSDFCSSTADNFLLNKPEWKEVRELVEQHFHAYVYNILRFTRNKFNMTTSWLTKAMHKEQGAYHNHNNCMFSGVLYLKAPAERATISFQNYEPRPFHLLPEDYNIWNNLEFFIDANVGDIVIFPSQTFHKICRNTSHEERVSLAFNFIPVGKLGEPTLDSYCEIYTA
tara:strand:+ start:70 stop:699 length:630 start_codon:yes stop_codon:yes gene_type:complete